MSINAKDQQWMIPEMGTDCDYSIHHWLAGQPKKNKQ